MIYDDLPADARSALEEIRDDAVRREQYLDFFKLRRLRETLSAAPTLPSFRRRPPALSTSSISAFRWNQKPIPITRMKARSNSWASGTWP